MASSGGPPEGRTDRKMHPSSSGHVIWGGVDTSCSSVSGSSWSWQSAEKEGRRSIIAQKIDAEGIEMLSDSATDSSKETPRGDASGRRRKEAARGTEEPARGDAGREGGAAGRCGAAASWAAAAPALRDYPPGLLPSAGSAQHELGTCKPCLFLFEKVGCRDGAACTYCHFFHQRRSGVRQSKGKRDRFKKLVSKVEASLGTENADEPPRAAARGKSLLSL